MVINPENIKVYKDYTLFHYLHGRCHLFAMAYKEYNPSCEINALFGVFENEYGQEEIHIEHVFLKLDENKYFDAKGKNKTLKEIENEYGHNTFETFFGDEKDYLQWFHDNLKNNYIFDFEENEKESLLSFFSSNKYFRKNKLKFFKNKY